MIKLNTLSLLSVDGLGNPATEVSSGFTPGKTIFRVLKVKSVTFVPLGSAFPFLSVRLLFGEVFFNLTFWESITFLRFERAFFAIILLRKMHRRTPYMTTAILENSVRKQDTVQKRRSCHKSVFQFSKSKFFREGDNVQENFE